MINMQNKYLVHLLLICTVVIFQIYFPIISIMLYLTLGYDHRLIDGAYGTKFLSRIKQLLENYDGNEIII